MAIEVGARAGKYELVRQLGAGGFGLVFLARDHELDRDCALKVLSPEHTGSAENVQRLLQEARAAARIRHPGIVTVFECGQLRQPGSSVDGMVYIAMELLGGESLAARLRRAALPVASAVAIARQIASAVGAAHQASIVHRDLKPENVFLVPDPETVSGERVKILDFGIAKLGAPGAANAVHTAAHQIFGSPRYMSPEQCRSTAHVDGRADIYSLGVMLFEMLCGEPPFADTDLGALIAKHQMVEPPRLHTKVTGLPPGLDELVASLLAKSPDARPQTMEAVQRALEPFRASTAHEVPRRAASRPAPAIVATERVLTNPAASPERPPVGPSADEPRPARMTEPYAPPRPSAPSRAIRRGLAVAAALTIGALVTRCSSAKRDAKPAAMPAGEQPLDWPAESFVTTRPPPPSASAAAKQTPGAPAEHRITARQPPPPDGAVAKPTPGAPVERPIRDAPELPPGNNESSLTPDAVLNKILSAYMTGLKRCYKQYLNKNASARGAVALSFTVNETGRLTNGNAEGFAVEIDSCISGQMGTWRFPVPRDKDNEAISANFQITLQLVPD